MSTNFHKWYQTKILEADLVNYSRTKGCFYFKPFGYKIWTNIQKILNKKFEELNIENVLLCSLILKSLINKEKEHFKGFKTEMIETKIKNEEYVLRPTSEILFCEYFKDNAHSYKELPMKLNQWCSVFRKEYNTKIFLRNIEFYWQEGHAIFLNSEEQNIFSKKMKDLYSLFLEKYLCIYSFSGYKTKKEIFAGAISTYAYECFLLDGQAIQVATYHNLGKKFSKIYDIRVTDHNNKKQFVKQSSWGISTRIIGTMIMIHSDDYGIRLSSCISPYKIVIIPLFSKKYDSNDLLEYINKFKDNIKIKNIHIDKYVPNNNSKNKWIKKGIPLIIVINPNDILNKTFKVIIRYNMKTSIQNFDSSTKKYLLDMIYDNDKFLYNFSKNNYFDKLIFIKNYKELKEGINNRNIIKAYFCLDEYEEEEIKKETYAVICNIVNEKEKTLGECIYCKKSTNTSVYFALSY